MQVNRHLADSTSERILFDLSTDLKYVCSLPTSRSPATSRRDSSLYLDLLKSVAPAELEAVRNELLESHTLEARAEFVMTVAQKLGCPRVRCLAVVACLVEEWLFITFAVDDY